MHILDDELNIFFTNYKNERTKLYDNNLRNKKILDEIYKVTKIILDNNPYFSLKIDISSSDEEIKQTYRKLSKDCHPDNFPDDKEKEATFKELNNAYTFLNDARYRSILDKILKHYLDDNFSQDLSQKEIDNLKIIENHDVDINHVMSSLIADITYEKACKYLGINPNTDANVLMNTFDSIIKEKEADIATYFNKKIRKITKAKDVLSSSDGINMFKKYKSKAGFLCDEHNNYIEGHKNKSIIESVGSFVKGKDKNLEKKIEDLQEKSIFYLERKNKIYDVYSIQVEKDKDGFIELLDWYEILETTPSICNTKTILQIFKNRYNKEQMKYGINMTYLDTCINIIHNNLDIQNENDKRRKTI